MSISRLNMKEFLTSGTWTAPAGVTTVLVQGYGGGSGGSGGTTRTSNNFAFVGGGGVSEFPVVLTVVPNTAYTITIGAGGTGGVGTARGLSGGDSSFGGLQTFKGFLNSASTFPEYDIGYSMFSNFLLTNSPNSIYTAFSYAGKLGVSPAKASAGGTRLGGASGNSGQLVGGVGGDGVSSGSGNNGTDAIANSGAGGGAGGNGSTGTSTGGAGGSGKITIIWVE